MRMPLPKPPREQGGIYLYFKERGVSARDLSFLLDDIQKVLGNVFSDNFLHSLCLIESKGRLEREDVFQLTQELPILITVLRENQVPWEFHADAAPKLSLVSIFTFVRDKVKQDFTV